MNGNTLTSLLYFLAFGFFFYWMMKKGGCGMHGQGGHGAHGRSEHGHDEHAGPSAQHETAAGSTKDPVCGMSVDPDRAAGTRSLSGRTFYFCTASCLAKFDADSEGFAMRASADASSMEHDHHQHQGR